ncbi:hypothetical protein SASPL_153141 [Salvia splendens]|uniref:Uncharacterized protein n=1 Tax=Salvia splendens TaxID=180675 RepID=A0A8X8W4A7_SALSN|nr:hypothetical protein SASPL_153141 [Salvia splendens]
MAAGESQKVRLSRILKLDDGTLFRVLINGSFHGMVLSRDDILKMTRIVFRVAESSLFAEGIVETHINRLFGSCIKLRATHFLSFFSQFIEFVR